MIFNSGRVDIHLDVASKTNLIQLHIKNLKIQHSSITVSTESGTPMQVDRDAIKEIPAPYEFLMIPLRSFLRPGQSIVVYIEYSGPIRKDLAGIYFSDYVNDDGETV